MTTVSKLEKISFGGLCTGGALTGFGALAENKYLIGAGAVIYAVSGAALMIYLSKKERLQRNNSTQSNP